MMANSRLRQKMKAIRKNLSDIVRERNEAIIAFGCAMICVAKEYGKQDAISLEKYCVSRAKEFVYEFNYRDNILCSLGVKGES